jgi:hypothetical protein
MNDSLLANGAKLSSQDLDDALFSLDDLLDYRVFLENDTPERLIVAYRTAEKKMQPALHQAMSQKINMAIRKIPAISENLKKKNIYIAAINHTDAFLPSHTIKRTIIDHRTLTKEYNHALSS